MGTMTCIYYYGIIQSIFTAPKSGELSLSIPHPVPQNSWQPLIIFTVSIISPFPDLHVVGKYIMQPFQIGFFFSCSNMHLSFLHVSSWLDSLILFSVE